MSKENKYKKMKAGLRYEVDLEWLYQFEDIAKLRFLNRSISHKRDSEYFTAETYKLFIEKFYNDEKFNYLYNEWIEKKDKLIKPSLDHIEPKANGGSLGIENLQFISLFENRAKLNIPPDEWEEIKKDIYYYL